VRKEYEVVESATQHVIVLDEAEDTWFDNDEGEGDWEYVDDCEPDVLRREYAAVVRGS
jgi:hypothetical protein